MDRMDFNHVQLPKKDVKVSSLRSSRPASPDTCDSGSNTPPWPTCNLKRHLSGAAATAAVNKKRKLEQAVIAAAAATNNSPSTSAVTMTTPSSTNAIMVIVKHNSLVVTVYKIM